MFSTKCFNFFLLLILCSFGESAIFADDLPYRSLKSPNLSDAQIIGSAAGIRAYRKAGIRIEPQYYDNKLIIHNYGHGGSDLSLSWGSVHEAVSLMQLELFSNIFNPDYDQIAVIGSGVIGLTTAHALMDKGYRVHIYSAAFPHETIPAFSEGVWTPILVTAGPGALDKSTFDRFIKTSYRDFEALAEAHQPRFKGIKRGNFYAFDASDSGIENIPDGVLNPALPVEVVFDNGKKHLGLEYDTILIDGKVYRQDMLQKAKQQGVMCTIQKFESIDELRKLPEDIIFNCTGYGSKELFGDADLVPVRGQQVYLKPQDSIKYALWGRLPGFHHDFYVIPSRDMLIIGGTFETGVDDLNVDLPTLKGILNEARVFFED